MNVPLSGRERIPSAERRFSKLAGRTVQVYYHRRTRRYEVWTGMSRWLELGHDLGSGSERMVMQHASKHACGDYDRENRELDHRQTRREENARDEAEKGKHDALQYWVENGLRGSQSPSPRTIVVDGYGGRA